jgi:hypothetical protein
MMLVACTPPANARVEIACAVDLLTRSPQRLVDFPLFRAMTLAQLRPPD